MCCRLDLGINFILLLNQTGLAVSRIFKIWRTWQHITRDETQITGCLHGTFWRTLLLDWLQLSTWNIRKYAMDLRINFGFESELWQEIWRTWQHEFDETQITGCLDWLQFSTWTSFILWRSLFPVELQDWTRAVWMKTWQWVSVIARIDSSGVVGWQAYTASLTVY